MSENEIKSINEELKKFEEWFKSIGNSPLSKYEAAIVKTYIAAVLSKKFKSSLSNQE